MPSSELSFDRFTIPSLSEKATDEEIEEAWELLNRLKQSLLLERGERAKRAQTLYQAGEIKKWAIFRKGLGETGSFALTEKAGEEKSREAGKMLTLIKEGLGLEIHLLAGLG
jgi:hypothetical protein